MNILKPVAALAAGATLIALLPESVKLAVVVLAAAACACLALSAAMHRHDDLGDLADEPAPMPGAEAVYDPDATIPLQRAA